ncbi:MAG: DUF354 domain-containing protein [Syntrophobacteraceae bacterium]|jgi:hypothetical protein
MTEPRKKKIWIDLDNTPHVPFFKPIIEELKQRGYSVLLTARDCFQVCGLADLFGLKYERIGRHHGKNVILKGCGLLLRSMQLAPIVLREKPDLAVSHGSRSQVILAQLLGLPSVVILDYEFAKVLTKPTWAIAPEVIPEVDMHLVKKGFLRYPGIKEDVYAPSFKPDPSIRQDLNFGKNKIIVTIRPPATEAHYHNPESEALFRAILEHLGHMKNVQIVMLPRNEKQAKRIRAEWSELFDNNTISIPDHVVDGLNLIWYSDLVVSGGGTMNREAAALNVPVYSFFRGKIGAVDKYLENTNRLILLRSTDDIHTKLRIVKRKITNKNNCGNSETTASIVESISRIAQAK